MELLSRPVSVKRFNRIKGIVLLSLSLTLMLGLAGCDLGKDSASENRGNNQEASASPVTAEPAASSVAAPGTGTAQLVDEQPSIVYYEIFVRSFYDSNGDGIGDLKGITEKLDYLNDGNPATQEDLGVGGIWLMPINPSPSYHGYDVTDYKAVNPHYGTMEDLKNLLNEAHKRGIKVIMDLVVNHTSSEHPWFKDAAESKDSTYRDWYIWAEDQGRDLSGVSAAGSGNPWVEQNGSHYFAGFWEGMPDLNFDNPEVRKEMKDVGKFWLEQGMDGFRIDAAKHIYEDFQSDNNEETTAKNVAWWQEFRSEMNAVNPDAYIVGEIADNSVAKMGAYLDNAFNSSFNFPLASTLISAAKSEKNNGLAYTLERTYKLYSKISGGLFTDATFLSNHDQTRVMSALDSSTTHAKTAAAMLLTLPGNPFIYYGEEIGMLGNKPDEHIREPMAWYQGGKGTGQTSWESAMLNSGNPSLNVESEQADKDSLLSRYKMLIAWRNEIAALRDGNIEEMETGQDAVLAYYRSTTQERVLVVHNLGATSVTFSLASSKEAPLSRLLKSTEDKAALDSSLNLTLPPYTTAILQ